MPQMANITVKKDNGTTDIVFTAMTPSGGDGVPAVWRSTSVGSAANHQPELRLVSKEASRGTKRHVRATFVYPQTATNTTTGVTSVVDRAIGSADFTVSKGMAQTDINEFASQFANLIASALAKEAVKSGFAPN